VCGPIPDPLLTLFLCLLSHSPLHAAPPITGGHCIPGAAPRPLPTLIVLQCLGQGHSRRGGACHQRNAPLAIRRSNSSCSPHVRVSCLNWYPDHLKYSSGAFSCRGWHRSRCVGRVMNARSLCCSSAQPPPAIQRGWGSLPGVNSPLKIVWRSPLADYCRGS